MQLVRSTKLKVLVLAVMLCLLSALPTFAQGDLRSGKINSVTRADCLLTINVTIDPIAPEVSSALTVMVPETDYIDILDDGVVLASIPFTPTPGVPIDVHYTVTNAPGTEAAGIGIYLNTNPENQEETILDSVDPFIVPFPCAPGTCNVVFPTGSVVGSLPYPTRAYWAPGKITPDVTLNAGTYWVVGQSKDDAGHPYYEIVLACQYLYVPTNTMGPSFEGPWQGQPLPSNAAS